MFDSGIVSISFRDHTPEAILQAAARAHLRFIEWGSDVYQLEYLAALQKQYGITCCS